ncbi:MAG: transcriptional repressor LexA [Acidobacteriota bacterium]|nr:transcriptional repressor LexA [Acidobacteriota bacterium]
MAEKPLSKRRRDILEFISSTIKDRGYPPTVREIGDAVGLKSSSTVHFHLNVLQKLGLIERDGSLTRAIRPRDAETDPPTRPSKGVRYAPLVGKVAAGQPIFAAENIEETLTLPAELFPDGDLFMLEVKGSSMIEAGILDGDLLVVQRQETAQNGDIVVALVEDEATVKRFFRHDDDIELRPENSQMESIFVKQVAILGRVRGVVRSL